MKNNFLDNTYLSEFYNKKTVVLLSGGLDSYVSFVWAKKYCDLKLALTFDYGQRASKDEIHSANEICQFYNIEHRVIKLPFLDEISNSALNNNDDIDFDTLDKNSARAVWVPNRNGLFINIAACFCDSYNYDSIIFGGNKEEAETFRDSSNDFCLCANEFLKYSTSVHPKVFSPLINLEKHEIIDFAIKLNVNFKLLKSCYNSTKNNISHCGKCESCKRLKSAILKSGHKDIINLLFSDY